MDIWRQKMTQLELAFPTGGKGEAPRPAGEGTEMPEASHETENPALTEHLMEEICQPKNLKKALKRVLQNSGAPGVDGMEVKELPGYLREHWMEIEEQLCQGTYQPKLVKRARIPKPGGGVRELGIPTALDRFIQQATLQVLQPLWDPTFSDYSYGFRPKRSAHQAVSCAQEYIAQGHTYVVDIDLERFFDRVNHDMLMGRLAKRIKDKRLLKLIRAYLNAGVMDGGLVKPTIEGTPQGGPLSPLLSNIVLNDLDRELEKRGHRFARYADDCNIYVRSERAAHRVMEGISHYITKRLKLKVNRKKSAIGRPWERKFLGFSFTREKRPRRRIAPQSIRRFKERIKELTRRNRGVSRSRMIEDLTEYLRGWRAYYGFCETPSVLRYLDSWIRRRLRSYIWKQWKHGPKRLKELMKAGVNGELAAYTAGSSRGPWCISHSKALQMALPNAFFDMAGLLRLSVG